MASSMQAVVRRASGVGLATVPLPSVSAGEVLVDVRMAGICRTDLFAADGTLPVAEGRVLGHELVGTIRGRASRVTVVPALPCGRCPECARLPERCARSTFLGVGADGAFAPSVRVPAACTREIPPALTDEQAAFVEPFAAALAVLDAPIPRGARVAVVGGGRIAALVRRVIACATAREPSVLDPAHAEEDAFDVVIETEPSARAIDLAITALRPHGLLVLKSRPIGRVPFDLARIVQKELRLAGVRYASFDDAIRWLSERRIAVDDLLGPALPLTRFAEAFALARRTESTKVFLSIEDHA